MNATHLIDLETLTLTPELEEWCTAESAHNSVLGARKHLARAVLALDAVVADDEAGASPDPRDLARALHAVRAARSLLRLASGCTRPLVKASAARKATPQRTAG